jgi:hypothetical protein
MLEKANENLNDKLQSAKKDIDDLNKGGPHEIQLNE